MISRDGWYWGSCSKVLASLSCQVMEILYARNVLARFYIVFSCIKNCKLLLETRYLNNSETDSDKQNLSQKIQNRDSRSERSSPGLTLSAKRQKSLHQRKFKESTNLCSKKSLFGKEISRENSEAEQQLSTKNETRSLMNIPAILCCVRSYLPPIVKVRDTFVYSRKQSSKTIFLKEENLQWMTYTRHRASR